MKRPIGIVAKVFANGMGYRGSSDTENSRMVPDATLLYTENYKVRIKCKWINPGKGVKLSSTPRSDYWKGSLRVALDIGRLPKNI